MDLLGSKEYGPKNNKASSYTSVVTDNISFFENTVPLRNRNAQTLEKFFENILNSSKKKTQKINRD